MPTLDEHIAQQLEQARASGELQAAQGYGKPLQAPIGWDETPDALRMPFKILKDAGAPPPEIEMFHLRAQLRLALEASQDSAERQGLMQQLSELEQRLALRLEALRGNSK